MTLQEYQDRAMTTCLPNSKNLAYMLLNLVGEVGEIAGKVSKQIRKGEVGFVGYGNIHFNEGDDEPLKKEVGDVLWQLSGLCSVMGWSLEDIAQQNLDKLADRQQRGVIASQGDNR